jgi:hypothetical protein
MAGIMRYKMVEGMAGENCSLHGSQEAGRAREEGARDKEDPSKDTAPSDLLTPTWPYLLRAHSAMNHQWIKFTGS